MQSAFGTVLWIVCALGIVVAFFALVATSKTWDEYGKNHLVMDHELGHAPVSGSAAELLEASNARRLRRGETPIDVEFELGRLTAPAIDAGLRAEIRDHVIARNHRRARTGKPPLDVEAEIEREIAGLRSL